MARTGASAALFVLVCCLLVGSVPARRPVELPTQVVPDAVARVVTAEPLPAKQLAAAEAANPTIVYPVTEEEEMVVDPARQLPQIFRCGDDDMAASVESPSLGGQGHPALKSRVREHGPEQERPGEDSFSDTDSDSDPDDEDNEDGIVAWFWRLARRF